MVSQGQVTLVCFAVKQEAKPFVRLAAGRSDIQILVTGMGRANALTAVREALTRYCPDQVITSGFAGGLNPCLSSGRVVYRAADKRLQFRLENAGATPARFVCAESVLSTARQKQDLFIKTQADAVEMESCLIYDLCREKDIPVAIVRAILDTAHEDLVLDFNKVMTPELRVDAVKLFFHILKSPGKISGLMRLQKQSAAVAENLAQVLSRTLATP
ncbi:MAG TPA: hypothetical protein VKY92_04620 [Verrucomicrobiae bacterium]|nr:hypothetical protein [Verrucomicrobiae bacterium]